MLEWPSLSWWWVSGEEQKKEGTREKRVLKELRDISMNGKIPGIVVISMLQADGDDDNIDVSHLTGAITGPINTPYEGGTFQLDISIPSDYPISPPKFRFRTEIWHPNVDSRTGETCQFKTSPAMTIEKFLLYIQAMLSDPELESPLNNVAAEEYLNDYPVFVATARAWTEAFASIEIKVEKFDEMDLPCDVL